MHLREHLQQFAKTLVILKNLAKEAKNLLQQFGILTCQIVSLANFLSRACRFPLRGSTCHRAIPVLASFPARQVKVLACTPCRVAAEIHLHIICRAAPCLVAGRN